MRAYCTDLGPQLNALQWPETEEVQTEGMLVCVTLVRSAVWSELTEHRKAAMLISGERDGNPLQCSCLEKPTDRGAWRAIVRGVAKSRTQLSSRSN